MIFSQLLINTYLYTKKIEESSIKTYIVQILKVFSYYKYFYVIKDLNTTDHVAWESEAQCLYPAQDSLQMRTARVN